MPAPSAPVRLNIPPAVEHCFTSLNLILQRNQNKNIHSLKGANSLERSEGYPYFQILILDPESPGAGCSIVDKNWIFPKMDFCVHGSSENVTLRAAYLPERPFTKLFLLFYFLYPHPSSLPLTHIKVTRRLQQCVERKTIRTFHFSHFHPVSNCLCSERGKCGCEKIFETAL